MKTIFTAISSFVAFFAAFALVGFTSCGSRSDDVIASHVDTTLYELATEDSVERDEPHEYCDSIDFDGKHFLITVSQKPAEDLPRVLDSSNGTPFFDNRVHISVENSGKNVIDRNFTKEDFAEAGEDVPMSKVVLGGMTFTEINGQGINFSAQLCPPGRLEGGHNFRVAFSLNGGNMRIVTDESSEDTVVPGKR